METGVHHIIGSQEDHLSYLIFSCVFIAKQAEATFDVFFPIIVYEWREQEDGAWTMKEQKAFQAAHKCFAQNITINEASYMYVADILIIYSLMYNFFAGHVLRA